MGEHTIKCEFIHGSVIALQIGDFITYSSENYYINRLPDIEKLNNATYKYTIVFESVLYNLARKLFISSDGLSDYSYNGTATDFITNIVASINEIDAGWTVGTVDSSDYLTLQFTNETCREALTRVAEAFDMEFSLAAKVISLRNSVGTTTTTRFEYGRDLGLYKLERVQVQDQNILTKVYGFGATTNIPSTYRGGAKRLSFAVAGQAASGYLVAAASGTYGVIEGQYTDDEIYPHRTGTLTAVSYAAVSGWNSNTDFLTDSAMDFNLNSYLIEGQTATIVFKSGDMSGVECEIWKYDNNASGFYITPFTDTDGYIQPNVTVHPHVGDSYTIVNISMPQSYIDTAETALKVATQAYLDENDAPMVVYNVDIDPKYAASVSLDIDVGDKVTVVDTALSINSLIRISGIEFPLVNPNQIKATIADFIPYTLQERIIKGTITNRKETVFVDRRQAETARRNTVNHKSLKDLLFDTDMYFDPVNIKPLSIETAYLAVGTKSRDFWLSLVSIKANYEGDANAIYVSAGSLIHLQISIAGLGYTWVIGTPMDQASLTPATPYYLYAKCSKSALTGEWILSASQITVEQVAGYYHFLIGVLFAVADGRRDFDFTNGMTYINGGTITTGKIQTIDTNNYFDLTNNKFHIGDANAYVDWNAASGVLGLKGSIIITSGGSGYGNLTDKPTSVSGINLAEGTKLASVASGATVGATWGTNLNSIPSRLAESAPDNALAFTNDFLGFHASGTSWPIKIANVSGVGKFYAGDEGNNYMDWDGTTLTIHGVFAGIDSNLATVAVPVGDLDGTVVATQANIPLSTQWFFDSNYVIGNKCSDIGVNYIANASGVDHQPPDAGFWDEDPDQPQVRIDTVTLDTGTEGTANILCDGVTKVATFFNSYTETAVAFVALYAADYLTGGVVVTSSGADIIFTAAVAGTDFTGATTITNLANPFKGSIKIAGNDIWENVEDNDTYGVFKINYKGYNGGVTRKRITIIGNGKGATVMTISEGVAGLNTGVEVWKGALTVPRYLTTAARDAAIPSPSYGMMIYLVATSKFQGYTSSWVDLH